MSDHKLRWAGRNSQKDELRKRIWTALEESGIGKGPIWDSITEFTGESEAAARLAAMPFWRSARVIKVNPDNPQIPVRYQALADGKFKVNPIFGWTKADLDAYFERHALPRHPLEADGYLSIGCMPCTSRVEAGEDPRAGRWRGTEKVECGIHRPAA